MRRMTATTLTRPLPCVADIDAALEDDTLALLARLFVQHGDAFRVHSPLLGKDLLVLSHPDHVRHVLVDNQANFSKGIGIERVAILLGNGLMTSDGSTWRSQRKAIQPAFHRLAVEAHAGEIVAANQRLADRITAAPCGPVDITHELSEVTLEIVLRAIFGGSYERLVSGVNPFALLTVESDRDLKFAYAFRQLGALVQREIERRRAQVAAVALTPTPTLSRTRERVRSTDLDAVSGAPDAAPNGTAGPAPDGSAGPAPDGSAGPAPDGSAGAVPDAEAGVAPDILQRLIDARDRHTGESMSDRQIRDEVFTLIVAGHETTASALAWTWLLIAQHPDVAERLHAEVDEASDAERARPDPQCFVYAQQVIAESLRLYPPGWLLTRRAREAASIAGIDVLPGDDILISPYLVHRHPDFWIDAERFDPDRFTPDANRARPRFCYLPFGAGPRACIGESFALAEMLAHIVTLAHRCRIELVAGQTINVEGRVNLRPRPAIRVQPVRRSS
jgi:enediyne biosynthesis protein E7